MSRPDFAPGQTSANGVGQRVLIDASNLRTGGAVQVAASFLDELAALQQTASSTYAWLPWVDVEASPQVVANLSESTAEALGVVTASSRPSDVQIWRRRPRHDVSFTIFGPAYGRPRARRTIVGFADGTSLFDVPAGLPTPRGRDAVTTGVRKRVSRQLFRRADHVIVEAPHVSTALQQRWHIPSERISVVPNCVNAAFHRPVTPVPPQQRDGWCYVTRGYPHKNLALLGQIGEQLHADGITDVRFTVTLTDAEWDALDESVRAHCRNVGPQRVDQLPQLYARSEGSVFCSLLESFSVTPLEALTSGTPLVASDRAFVRDVCADAAWYADPTSPVEWARAIRQVRQDAELRDRMVTRGREIAAAAPDARDRATAYLRIIDEQLATLR